MAVIVINEFAASVVRRGVEEAISGSGVSWTSKVYVDVMAEDYARTCYPSLFSKVSDFRPLIDAAIGTLEKEHRIQKLGEGYSMCE